MKLHYCISLTLLLNYFFATSVADEQFKLELLQVLFRHGDRTPAVQEVYKNDPYTSVWEQTGHGQLTKIGMQRVYALGEKLRKLYDDFLGEYHNDEVYARSTNVDRTKMSLQLALAGLYPPSDRTRWSNEILWSPIPTHYEAIDKDLFFLFYRCPRNAEMKQLALRKVLTDSRVSRAFIERVGQITGVNLSTQAFKLYGNLRSALSLGLPLPYWCSPQDFAQIERLVELDYDAFTSSAVLKRLMGGEIVEEFLKNIDNHEIGMAAKKVYLYAVHEINVAAFANVHNFTGVPKIPDYGSAVVLEKLRDRDENVYLRMFLWSGVSEKWIPLKLENCDYACPLADYRKLVSWILPDDESRTCKSPRSSCNN